jgi:hypothetical protein
LKINHLATQPLTSKPNRGQSLFWSQSYDFWNYNYNASVVVG